MSTTQFTHSLVIIPHFPLLENQTQGMLPCAYYSRTAPLGSSSSPIFSISFKKASKEGTSIKLQAEVERDQFNLIKFSPPFCVCVCMLTHIWKAEDNLGEWFVLPSTVWVSQIKLRLSGLAAGVFTYWVSLLALFIFSILPFFSITFFLHFNII